MRFLHYFPATVIASSTFTPTFRIADMGATVRLCIVMANDKHRWSWDIGLLVVVGGVVGHADMHERCKSRVKAQPAKQAMLSRGGRLKREYNVQMGQERIERSVLTF